MKQNVVPPVGLLGFVPARTAQGQMKALIGHSRQPAFDVVTTELRQYVKNEHMGKARDVESTPTEVTSMVAYNMDQIYIYGPIYK